MSDTIDFSIGDEFAEQRSTIAINVATACGLAAGLGVLKEDFLRDAARIYDIEIRRVASDRRALGAMVEVYESAIDESNHVRIAAHKAAMTEA